jgi:hypothetical protein
MLEIPLLQANEPRSWANQRLLSAAFVVTPLPFLGYCDALPEPFALPIIAGVGLLPSSPRASGISS